MSGAMSRITVTDIGRRVIRVFLSSTFADLDSERTYLARQVFPRLRSMLMKYNITLMDIDLRWGITEEEAKSGKTVKLCLEQIENTRPFFIGILGNRYGWVPDPEYLSDISLTENDRDKSVTEIEIRHGALDLPSKSNAAFFFKQTDDEYPEDADKKTKLKDLKAELEASSYPVRPFQSCEELGQLVEQAVMSWVKEYYDLESLTRKDLIEAEQKHIVDDYLDGFVSCKVYESIIDDFISSAQGEGMNNVLPVAGAVGAGKRAFAAYAAKRMKEKGFVQNIIQYYFEDNCDSQGVEDAVEFMIGSIKEQFPDLNTEGCYYDYSFPEVLNRLLMHLKALPTDRRCVLALGGINLLEQHDFDDWVRLVTMLPKSVIAVFTSTMQFRNRAVLDKYYKDRCYSVGVFCFSDEERASIMKRYFEPFGKNFNDEYIASIITSRNHISGYNVYRNMGHLHLMLNEIRIFGDFDHIGDYVADFANVSDDEASFLSMLLGNWSQAYDHNGNRMVEIVLALLSVLKFGLDESDILDYLKAPAANWQRFIAAAEPFLYMKEGRYYMHQGYRSAFTVVFTDTIKPVRYDWVEYIEKKIAEDGYKPDYKIYELTDLYRSLHFSLEKHLRGDIPDYYVPECFTAEQRYDPVELIRKLFVMAGNVEWMTWLLERGETVLLKKIFGYLEKYQFKVGAYMQDADNEKLMRLVPLYESAGYFGYAIHACEAVKEDELSLGDKIRLYFKMAHLYHRVGEKEKAADCACKALGLSPGAGTERLPESSEIELTAFIADSVPIEDVDRNLLLDLMERMGEPNRENLKAMSMVLDLIQKKFRDDNDVLLMACDTRVMAYEHAGDKDSMRCEIANAYLKRACVLNEMGSTEDSYLNFYVSFDIYDSVRSKSDYHVADSAYAAYMAVNLALQLNEGLDWWRFLHAGVVCMSLLLYHRKGWDEMSWMMEDFLRHMETVVQVPGWESNRSTYERCKAEYEEYKKSRKS